MKYFIAAAGLIFIANVLKAQKNLFEENFKTNKNKWALFSNIKKDSAKLSVTNEQLVLDNMQLGFAVSLNKITNKKINISTDEEATVSASFNHISGNNKTGYGLLLGEKLPNDKFNGYCFLIADTGYYRMYVAKDGKQIKYVEWTASNDIKINNATNTLTIVKKRNQYHFLINGQWLFNIADAGITVNSIGIFATDKQKVALDNIKVESFAKEKDKKDTDKINELTALLELSNTFFEKAFRKKNTQNIPTTWLPFLQDENKNVNVLFGSYHPYYEDNWSYEKTVAEQKVKQYKSYIEKAMGKFEKVERATPLGKETYWLNKNEKYVPGVYIMLEEFALSDNHFIKIRVKNDKDVNRESIEKMK